MFLQARDSELCQQITESDMRGMGQISSQPQKGPALPTFDLELLSSRTVRQHISFFQHRGLWITEALANEYTPQRRKKKNLTISENQADYKGQVVGMQKEIRDFYLFKVLIYAEL